MKLPGAMESRVGSAEQSNTSILYGDKLILKLFRRLQAGENPDVEIGRFLTEVGAFQADRAVSWRDVDDVEHWREDDGGDAAGAGGE